VEVPARHKDGHELWVELRLSALPDQPGHDGGERHVLAVVRDVTLRKRAEEEAAATTVELAEANAALTAANQALHDFIALVVHDLRTPLTALIGAAALLLERDDQPAVPVTRLAGMIERQAVRISALVDTLLLAESVEAGTVVTHPDRHPVGDLVTEAIENAGVEGVVLAAAADHAVFADRDHVVRMLTNLIANADKYGAPPITIGVEVIGAAVTIDVSDQGEGLPADMSERLFHRFARSALHHARPGTGLGLALVEGLARANGGTVRYRANTPKGATFAVDLPAARERRPAAT
jgi:signal transduction histidine kinase